MSAPQGSAARLVEVALGEVGTIEGPKDNQTKYGAFTKSNFQPWCGSFVMWCANEAQVKVPNTVYTPGGADAFKKAKQWFDASSGDKPQPGDIVYFDFPADGVDRISHVGIVVKDNGDGTLTAVEGNTAGNAKGDQRNGGECCKKIRAYKKDNKPKLLVGVVGWGRPKFGEPVAQKVAKPQVTDPLVYPGETIDQVSQVFTLRQSNKLLAFLNQTGFMDPSQRKL